MRRRIFFFASALLALGVACAASGESSSSPDDDANAGSSPEGASDRATVNGDAAGEFASEGNPLCGRIRTCFPDDDGIGKAIGDAGSCARITDASAASADASAEGCRLVESDAGAAAVDTACTVADLRGIDGARCETGAGCAPGFDCIAEEKGPVCRRYCCSGTCEKHTSHNGGPTFCDVRTVAGAGARLAPVCMPIKTCKLLEASGCESTETCAVVDDKGTTGCVPRGPQQVGESCDVAHCDVDLTCLGSAGKRRCYKLCRTTPRENTCGAMQTCTTGAIFLDSTYGVCKCGSNPQCSD